MLRSILFALILTTSLHAQAFETFTFPSEDSVRITADYYKVAEDAPLIILFHQAGWSRGEYRQTAPKLNAMGYNCLAIDQRAGNIVNNVPNLTAERAELSGKSATYLDALQDMRAALAFAEDSLNALNVTILGSSYSASLCLVLAAQYQEQLSSVIAFSPGEYFRKMGKSGNYVQQHAAKLTIPVFVTSAKDEHNQWKAIFEAIPSDQKVSFLPAEEGQHGSRALWENFPQHQAYWDALTAFLKQYVPATPNE